MALRPRDFSSVPEDTARVAQAAFPQGNAYLTLRDELGDIYEDEMFAALFSSSRGRPAESPGRLALVTALEFAENLSDRQAADAVRGRIDWKYLLGLELTDSGFHYARLSEFRKRVLEGEAEGQLLELLLQRLTARGLIKERGQQRTDSTYVVAAIRELNRLEFVGETLRNALNSLAVVVPDWLRQQVTPEWFDRYGRPFDQWRLPKSKEERAELAEIIGRDGYHLLQAVYAATPPPWLHEVPAVQTLRLVWIQQYYIEGDSLRWRTAKELPPGELMIQSPYDTEARYSKRGSQQWTGYRVHLTETCEQDKPLLITNVETTASTTPDGSMTETIHQHLQEKDLLPGEHLVDAGYTDAQILVSSEQEYGVDIIGPVQPDSSWQARAGQGFDIACFAVDWEAQQVTCPQGQRSTIWSPSQDKYGNPVIHVQFAKPACLACPQRSQCTRSRDRSRAIQLRPKEQHIALQLARQRQTTQEFKEQYATRAGVEGTIAHTVHTTGLRRSRYIGLSKTHLQHVFTAVAINLLRLANWFAETPRARTRCSRFATLACT